MARIDVVQTAGTTYRVTVTDAGTTTGHDVTVTADDVRRYAPGATAERLLEASFEFLLEREPKEAILRRFDLPVIERYFPGFPATIAERLRNDP